MFKKYISYLGVLVLACFSFYYTDKAVDIVKRNGCKKNFMINEMEGISPSVYADIYSKVKVSEKIYLAE